MSSVYMYVNFRFTKTVSLNIHYKTILNDSLETLSFIAPPCLFVRLIGEILFTKKAGKEKKTTHCSHTNSQLEVSKVGWNNFCYMYFVHPTMIPFSVCSQRLLFSKNETWYR